MERVVQPSPERVRELMALGVPFVAEGLLDTWGALHWSLATLQDEFGDQSTCIRLHPRHAATANAIFEGQCIYVQATLGEFCRWLDDSLATDAAATSARPGCAQFPSAKYVGYADYQDMPALFRGTPDALDAVDWSTVIGGAPCDGAHSTLWLGSEGAHTPTHYDTYGNNLVAQCLGIKRWRLLPPGCHAGLQPTRVPFEESSVFTAQGAGALGGLHSRNAEGKAPTQNGSQAGPAEADVIEVDLQAGEVLFVPKHWWHHVTTLSSYALSINTWLDAPGDEVDRLRESMVRLVACSLIRQCTRPRQPHTAGALAEAGGTALSCSGDRSPCNWVQPPPSGWVNPTEETSSTEINLHLLNTAMEAAAAVEAAAEEDVEAAAAVEAATAEAVKAAAEAAAAAAAMEVAAAAVVEMSADAEAATAVVEAATVVEAAAAEERAERWASADLCGVCAYSVADDEAEAAPTERGEEDGAPRSCRGNDSLEPCVGAAPSLSMAEVARAMCLGPALEAAACSLHALCASSPRQQPKTAAQLRAPLARLLRTALLPSGGQSDEVESASGSLQEAATTSDFEAALARLRAAPGCGELTVRHIIDATCTGVALDDAIGALRVRHAARLLEAKGTKRARTGESCAHAGGCDCSDQTCTIG